MSAMCLAVTLACAPTGPAAADVSCTRVEDACLTWNVQSPAFAADGRFLYFSYRYGPTRLEYSRTAIGRVALDSGKFEAVARSCDANYEAPAFSPDGKLLAFVVTGGKGVWPYEEYSRMSADERWRSSRQIAYVANSERPDFDAATYVSDLRATSKDAPRISPDGRYVYYAHSVVPTATTISRFELSSGKIDDVMGPSSREQFYANPMPREYFYSLHSIRFATFEGRTQLLFLASTPHDADLTRPLVKPPLTAYEVKLQSFLYRYDPVARSVELHPVNLRPDIHPRRIHAFAIDAEGALVFAPSNYVKSRKGDLLRLDLRATDAEPTLFAAIDETTFAFALSPNGRWIAQTWQKLFETSDGRSLGSPIVLRLIDRRSGAVRDFDFGAPEIAEALLLRCARQPMPEGMRRR